MNESPSNLSFEIPSRRQKSPEEAWAEAMRTRQELDQHKSETHDRIEELCTSHEKQSELIRNLLNNIKPSFFHSGMVNYYTLATSPFAESTFELNDENDELDWFFEYSIEEYIKEIRNTLSVLEKDFDGISNRLAYCDELEGKLENLEEYLDEHHENEAEPLNWLVSTLRDALNFNFAENLTGIHLDIFKHAIDLIEKKQLELTKEEYDSIYRELLESGLSLLPNTEKVLGQVKTD